MDEGIDTGDILVQRACPIGWTDTYGDVLGRVVDAVPSVVEAAVALLVAGGAASGGLSRRPAPTSAAAWTAMSGSIGRTTAATCTTRCAASRRPGPGARTLWRAQVIRSGGRTSTRLAPLYRDAGPGGGPAAGEGVMVKTGDSTLLIQEIEMEGSAPMRLPAWPVGTRLGLDPGRAVRALMARVGELEARQTQRSKS